MEDRIVYYADIIDASHNLVWLSRRILICLLVAGLAEVLVDLFIGYRRTVVYKDNIKV